MIDSAQNDSNQVGYFEVRVLRQDEPGKASYWQRYRIRHEPDMNVISVLQQIAARPTTMDGRDVAPVAWECNCLEEVCGACTMVVNGRTRQACSALVDNLLKEQPGEIELRPMSKFPVIRDLMIDRQRMFRALESVKAWIPVDGYYEMGAGPAISRKEQEQAYPFSQCMTCGCCTEACPQFTKIEVPRRSDETDEQFAERETAEHDQGFLGPHAIGQTVLVNANPTGSVNADERLDALTAPGGIQLCGNAQNCVAVCPKEIPLTTAIAQAGRAITLHSLKKWFG